MQSFTRVEQCVVVALASQQCDPGFDSQSNCQILYGLSLLVVNYSALRGFSLATQVFSSSQKLIQFDSTSHLICIVLCAWLSILAVNRS